MTHFQRLVIAAVEVAQPARRPDVFDVVTCDGVLDDARLLRVLQADQVLTVLAADVAGVQPVTLVGAGGAVPPREEVVVSVAEHV